MYSKGFNKYSEYKNMISSLYRKYFINSGLITSWPEAPTLDDAERYRGLTLNSADMLEENFFRMPTTSTPTSLGIAPIFNKSISYSKKRDSFSTSGSSFDSFKNMYIYQLIIFLFKDDFMREINLLDPDPSYRNDSNTPIIEDENNEDTLSEKDISEVEDEEFENIENNELIADSNNQDGD